MPVDQVTNISVQEQISLIMTLPVCREPGKYLFSGYLVQKDIINPQNAGAGKKMNSGNNFPS
jgi:hypothetical protein